MCVHSCFKSISCGSLLKTKSREEKPVVYIAHYTGETPTEKRLPISATK